MSKAFVRCRRFLWCAALLLLGACGPGSGGTGTGPGSGSGGSPTLMSFLFSAAEPEGCGNACGRVDLQGDSTQVQLVSTCGRFTFAGTWSMNASGQALLAGKFERSLDGLVLFATLDLRFAGDTALTSNMVNARVLDSAGAVILGPIDLPRASAVLPRPDANCPG